MSKFFTPIPVDVNGVIEKLPPGSFIHSIDLEKKSVLDKAGIATVTYCVNVIWDNDNLKTAYTFPLECPVEKLAKADPGLKSAAKPKGKK
jgi:hypothetical protein